MFAEAPVLWEKYPSCHPAGLAGSWQRMAAVSTAEDMHSLPTHAWALAGERLLSLSQPCSPILLPEVTEQEPLKNCRVAGVEGRAKSAAAQLQGG